MNVAAGRPPDTGACHVWLARVPADTDRFVDRLDDVELGRRARLRRRADRDRFTAAAVLLRRTVAATLGVTPDEVSIDRTCERCGEPHGRPVVVTRAPDRLEVSVSHAGAHVAVAICPGRRVGVDVEVIPREYADLLPTACSPEEVDEITDARGFAVAWTRKEAFLKATGEGLRRAPSDVVVAGGSRPPAVRSLAGAPPPPTQLVDLAVDREHVGAVAILTDTAVDVVIADGDPVLAYP